MRSQENYGIFIDRDGVLIQNRPDYIRRPEHIQILPQAIQACAVFEKLPYPVFLVSNQSCVGRGILSLEEMLSINDQVVDTFKSMGLKIETSYLCPHAPEDRCECRKPNTAFFDQAFQEHNIRGGWMIGDSLEDMRAAQRAHLHPMLVLTGRGEQTASQLRVDQYPSILEAVEAIWQWSNDALILDASVNSVAKRQ